jgi:hypothetical protein
MGRFVTFVLIMMVASVLLGFALEHLGMIVVILVVAGLLGRRLRRHGV